MELVIGVVCMLVGIAIGFAAAWRSVGLDSPPHACPYSGQDGRTKRRDQEEGA